jgi:D-alanine transaminase
MGLKSSDPGWAWFGGRLVPFYDARVPIEDRGLQFGESVYEVVAVVAGEPFRLPDHVERMAAGAREVGIERGVPDLSTWRAVIAQLYRREPHRTAVLYAQLTGGTAPRRHLPPDRPEPFFFAYLRRFTFPVPAEAARGIAVITVPEIRWQRRDVKATMLLPAILAKRDAVSRGAEEAIFVGQDGFVNEGASSTLFSVTGHTVTTPPPTQRVLPGVSMKAVEGVCRELGIEFAARPITLSDLHRADELFVASTTLLLMPVVRLNGNPVGNGTAGGVTLQLAYHFQRQFWGQAGP